MTRDEFRTKYAGQDELLADLDAVLAATWQGAIQDLSQVTQLPDVSALVRRWLVRAYRLSPLVLADSVYP